MGWAVAAGFNPARRFQSSDLKLMKVIWKLEQEHCTNSSMYAHMKETLFGIVRCLSAAIDAARSAIGLPDTHRLYAPMAGPHQIW